MLAVLVRYLLAWACQAALKPLRKTHVAFWSTVVPVGSVIGFGWRQVHHPLLLQAGCSVRPLQSPLNSCAAAGMEAAVRRIEAAAMMMRFMT